MYLQQQFLYIYFQYQNTNQCCLGNNVLADALIHNIRWNANSPIHAIDKFTLIDSR